MTDRSSYRTTTITLHIQADGENPGWMLHASCNDGYTEVRKQRITPEQALSIAMAIDAQFQTPATMPTSVVTLVRSTNYEMRTIVAEAKRSLESLISRHEGLVHALSRWDAVEPGETQDASIAPLPRSVVDDADIPAAGFGMSEV